MVTGKDKELLIKQIFARLPYGIILRDEFGTYTKVNVYNVHLQNLIDRVIAGVETLVLRPMSSMTEEEKDKYCDEQICYEFAYFVGERALEWLYANNFDYFDMIEKGLAVEEPEDMYKV